jgi:hypothetical protein
VLTYTTPKRDREIVEVPFELDGEKYVARKPKDSVLVFLAAAQSDSASDADKVYAVMEFLRGSLTIASQQRIQSRLRDFEDPLEIPDLMPIITDVSAEFGGDLAEAMKKAAGGQPAAAVEPERQVEIPPAVAPNRAARRQRAKAPAAAPPVAAPAKAPRKTSKAAKAAAPAKKGRALPK